MVGSGGDAVDHYAFAELGVAYLVAGPERRSPYRLR